MIPTPHVLFQYNKEKDIANICIGMDTVKKGRAADAELTRIVRIYGHSVTDELLAAYVEKRWGGKETTISDIVRQMQEQWNSLEERFFLRLAEHMQIKDFVGVKTLGGYFSSRYGSGYNENQNWFAVSLHSGLFRNVQVAMHEIMHIVFHKAWWHVCRELGVPEKNIWDVKEATTVLLNVWFKEDLIELDWGYEEHAELRHLIKEWFLESHDFKTTVLNSCEYMKKIRKKAPYGINP